LLSSKTKRSQSITLSEEAADEIFIAVICPEGLATPFFVCYT
jgi:hypothetical protein